MYKNIIFDLGGVLLTIDYSLTINAFKQLGIPDFEQHYSKQRQDGLFNKLETGKINTAQFINGINAISRKPIPAQKIIDAWNAMLLDFPAENIGLLNRLKKDYKVFLLSNTNEIHLEAFSQIIFAQHGIKNLEGLFHKAYYSHLIGMRKPGSDIFNHILTEQKLDPSATLFIDDSAQHVAGAKEEGIKGILFEGEKTLNNLF